MTQKIEINHSRKLTIVSRSIEIYHEQVSSSFSSYFQSGHITDLKGRVSLNIFSFMGPVGHNIWWDLKMVKNCKISSVLGLEIRHSGFRRGLKSGALASGVVVIWHSGLGGGCNLAF